MALIADCVDAHADLGQRCRHIDLESFNGYCFLLIYSTLLWFCKRTAKALIRLRGFAVWSAFVVRMSQSLNRDCFCLCMIRQLFKRTSRQRRIWSDCADSQSDLSLCCPYMSQTSQQGSEPSVHMQRHFMTLQTPCARWEVFAGRCEG